ncbi:transcriptional coactivator p15/PC4 family protein [Paraburkholderia atlantica]|uniref:transcriptional coactivator p15/PC4 family protein n=1 Tax=Paraburkholderia atlantica TaxID=2654982 RepID=UPI001611DFB2|nr:transcriptional coactivator p15/PC4 family protein [Paraburkholderia atlantica]MBB5420804.1 hypothetical protein [Paraburkholderia atlantica]
MQKKNARLPEGKTSALDSADSSSAKIEGAIFLDLQKNDSERLRVIVKEYRGRTYIDLRVWYLSNGGYSPSQKGVTLRPTQVTEIVQGLMLAAQSFDPKEAA